ncbi:hypothetical protein KBY75_01710 [Cyanobium sp. T1G-Tous]|uniref:hypothetical protein n=1 Tax=unclassified Cyanobium TaxID=2627006 RepID=UPI0020CE92F8|nr:MULTISPECIES: hypothetical protein [unclassified Cyanobium]MCP9777331.1 hypothetical protein [Cyanobium sp. Tous-M-B4]MCP9802280.1 hypothetical protein [Cyanobium sp. T1G-Tous]MCP9875704.1 hypothetical protein [Cyanobium sp. A2C-AMD]
MPSRDGSHRTAFSLLLLLGVAIGLHVYAVRVKEVKPSRRLPKTSLSPDGQGVVAGSQSSRIRRLIED